ncbi:hypothetical protein ACFV3R_11420 [Streptomyces sp. NPDC059740]|uniref:hypothetical protein n=1 Tax=Streptomyces sp. NPDC059740 TaxID=3346926 RepID=UPI00364A7846
MTATRQAFEVVVGSYRLMATASRRVWGLAAAACRGCTSVMAGDFPTAFELKWR